MAPLQVREASGSVQDLTRAPVAFSTDVWAGVALPPPEPQSVSLLETSRVVGPVRTRPSAGHLFEYASALALRKGPSSPVVAHAGRRDTTRACHALATFPARTSSVLPGWTLVTYTLSSATSTRPFPWRIPFMTGLTHCPICTSSSSVGARPVCLFSFGAASVVKTEYRAPEGRVKACRNRHIPWIGLPNRPGELNRYR